MTVRGIVIPSDPDDLICDTCPERFPYKGDMLRTFEAARVKGWHIYAELSARGSRDSSQSPYTLDRVNYDIKLLCPTCIGTPRSRLDPPPVVLEGQSDMFEVLGVEVEPEQKQKKGKKGREMS